MHISPYITNIIYLVTVYLSGFQHVQLRRPNPLATIQFWMIAFCLIMMLFVAFCNKLNPWLSTGFLLLAIACLVFMIRQHRMLPPMRQLE